MTPAEHAIEDPGSFVPVDGDLRSSDPLAFPDYGGMQAAARAKAGSDEAVTAGPASIDGIDVELALFSFDFLGGSMGEVAGERLARAMERAAARGVPFVLRTSTGGARMQEGMAALVQMPKTVVARRALASARVPYLAVLGHPTTGGVFASIGSLADVTVAESDATIGFAGPRVAERFTGDPLEGGSHSAATAFGNGLVDEVVPASETRSYLAQALMVLSPDTPGEVTEPTESPAPTTEVDAWGAVEAARDEARAGAPDVQRALGDPHLPLRGDRGGTDDPAVSATITRLKGRRVLILALERAHWPGPGAYRKARRCIGIAERLGLPVITLVDTRGADPSSGSENTGIASEIARTFDRLLTVRVPTISVVTGEGGSGGALAFACTDRLLATTTSIFSVIGPEGAAEILWRDGGRAPEAARLLRLTAADLVDMNIADALVPDLDPERLAGTLAYHLDRLAAPEIEEVLAARSERWRRRI